MHLPAVFIVPRSLTEGIPSEADARAYDATLNAVTPGASIALVWADGTVTCSRRRADGWWEAAGRSDRRAA